MLERLAEVEWHRLEHAYGTVTDVPDQLRAIASGDATAANKAIDELFGNILHQGTVYQATAPAVPFLLELVSDPAIPLRKQILLLLSGIAEGTSYLDVHADLLDVAVEEEALRQELEWVAAAHAAVADGIPALLTLLTDADPTIRAAVPYLLACFPEDAADLAPVVRAPGRA